MQEFFSDRAELCTVKGKDSEKIVFKRASKSYGSYLENFMFSALLDDETKLVNGDIVNRPKDGKTYYMVARRKGSFSEIGKLVQCNCNITITRHGKKYDGNEFVGYEDQVIEVVDSSYKEVSGKMKLYDAGLLPKTTITFIVPIGDIQLKDRVIFTDQFEKDKEQATRYVIDRIDLTTNDGFYTLQCSIDEGDGNE